MYFFARFAAFAFFLLRVALTISTVSLVAGQLIVAHGRDARYV